MPNTLIVALLIAGATLLAVLIDTAARGRFRPGFAWGTVITGCAVTGLIFLPGIGSGSGHLDKTSQLGLVSLLIVACLGNLMVDQNNIEDQEAGRMSKWGSWWDGFGDSYRSNIFDKWETWLAMVFLGGMFVFILTKSPAEAEKTNIVETSRPTPTAPFVSTAKPKSQSSTHSRKTASNKVRPTHHKSAASKQSSH